MELELAVADVVVLDESLSLAAPRRRLRWLDGGWVPQGLDSLRKSAIVCQSCRGRSLLFAQERLQECFLGGCWDVPTWLLAKLDCPW